MEKQITEADLKTKKEMLHKLIDKITALDYVETNSKIVDVMGKSQVIHQIFIEKNGNVLINPKKSIFDDD